MFESYEVNGLFDEMFDAGGRPRPHYASAAARLAAMGRDTFVRRAKMADAASWFTIEFVMLRRVASLFPLSCPDRVCGSSRSRWAVRT